MSNVKAQTIHPPVLVTLQYVVSSKAAAGLVAAARRVLNGSRKWVRNPSRLYELSDHVLADIGLSRAEIGQGPAESFWRM